MNADDIQTAHLRQFLSAHFAPLVLNWRMKKPIEGFRPIPQAVGGERYAELQTKNPAHLARTAKVFSALNWLLLGGAARYFPHTAARQTVFHHVQLYRSDYLELLDRATEIFPATLLHGVREIVEGAALSAASGYPFRNPAELQPFFQTAWSVSADACLDEDVDVFLVSLFDGRQDWLEERAVLSRDRRFAGFIRFIQAGCVLNRIVTAMRTRVDVAEDAERFRRVAWQVHGCLSNTWTLGGEIFLGMIGRLLEIGNAGALRGYDFLHDPNSLRDVSALRLAYQELIQQPHDQFEAMPLWTPGEGLEYRAAVSST